tara:strand:- start:490 stop:789 length:300 start_codon:yes stop_codon:yes gene_type:complete
MQINSKTILDSLIGTLNHLISVEAITNNVSIKEATSTYVLPLLIVELRKKGAGILSLNEFFILKESIADLKMDKPVLKIINNLLDTIEKAMLDEDFNKK